MNGLNGTMADPKELAHDSPEPQENRINEHKEKDVEAQSTETVEELNNHKHRDANSLQNEDTCLHKNINSINNEDHKPNENVNCNTNINETSLEHSQSTLNLKTNENSTGNLENDKTEKIPISQSNPEPNLEQNNVLSIEETCKKDLILQNGNPVLSKNGVSGGETENESEHNETSEASAGRRAEKTASVHLQNDDHDEEVDGHDGDKSSQNSAQKTETSVAPLLKNNKTDSHNGKDNTSPEDTKTVNNIDNGVVEDKKPAKPPAAETPVPLRRSSRAIKRKRYDDEIENGDDTSDDCYVNDSHRRKYRAIVVNDTKTLVEMAAKQMKSGVQKKEPTVVIIDTNSMTPSRGGPTKKNRTNFNSSSLSAQCLYQSIVARGTTVTPVSSKNSENVNNNNSSQSQQSILPSLTDDMFVVEAPSFIVPYVYEKPSKENFRKFVDNLANELKEEMAKVERQREKEKEGEKEGDSKEEKVDKKDGDESEDKEVVDKLKDEQTEDSKSLTKDKKKEPRRQRNDDDDMSWDGESSSSSDDDIASDEEDKTILRKAKTGATDDIKRATDLNTDQTAGKADSYFDLSLGKFFMNIGHNIVQEYVQNDLLKQQNRKLYREKKGGHSTKLTESSIASLKNNLEFSKENNAPYKFEQKKCKFCPFKSESLLVLSHHLETTPHMKNGVYTCNFCSHLSKSPHDILFHMKTLHNTRGKLERPPAYHQCPNCPFEDNGKGKLARHFVSCSKKFKPETNLAPPPEWEPPAKIPKLARSRNPMMSSYHNAFNRSQMASHMKYATNNNMAANMASNMASNMAGNFRPKNRMPVTIAPMPTQMQALPMLKGGVTVRHASGPVLGSNYANGKSSSPKLPHQPSISITPLPRQPQPVPVQTQQNKNTCVICEICDGYIKDLEQLRNHMQWIHKVKIHPKMIYNRRPLNCQKCQFRFFTDQGLERHLLGSHGLVTSSMQEAANKNKDAGRCPVCGRVYQWKLLDHVGRDHNITLKPAHLSYKCTVCTATFGMYKLFENHVYSAHSIVAKRVMDKGKTHSVTAGQSLLKPMKINDEITIIPQPAPGKSDVKDD